MAVPTWVTGQVLTASDVNTWFVPLVAYKTASTARTSASLVIDPDLQITVAANAAYQIMAGHNWLAVAGVGISWNFTSPASSGGAYQVAYSLSGVLGYTWATTVSAGSNGAPNYGAVIHGLLTTTNSGTFGLQWGSGTGGSTCTLGVGSILVANRVG